MNLNESLGISNLVKTECLLIYTKFIINGYINNYDYTFNGRNFKLSFIKSNNYNSIVRVDKSGITYLELSIPDNYKPSKVKEVITHELTHMLELSLNYNSNPLHNKIYKAVLETEIKTKSEVMHDFLFFIYKTLDNEVNAYIAQTYTYLKNVKSFQKSDFIKALKEYALYQEYIGILNIDVNNFVKLLDTNEIEILNQNLTKYGIKPKSIEKWFLVIKDNANNLIKKQFRIIAEIMKDNEPLKELYNKKPFRTIPNFEDYVKKYF
jgi:hypothetical protein